RLPGFANRISSDTTGSIGSGTSAVEHAVFGDELQCRFEIVVYPSRTEGVDHLEWIHVPYLAALLVANVFMPFDHGHSGSSTRRLTSPPSILAISARHRGGSRTSLGVAKLGCSVACLMVTCLWTTHGHLGYPDLLVSQCQRLEVRCRCNEGRATAVRPRRSLTWPSDLSRAEDSTALA